MSTKIRMASELMAIINVLSPTDMINIVPLITAETERREALAEKRRAAAAAALERQTRQARALERSQAVSASGAKNEATSVQLMLLRTAYLKDRVQAVNLALMWFPELHVQAVQRDLSRALVARCFIYEVSKDRGSPIPLITFGT